MLARSRVFALFGVVCRFVTRFRFLIDVAGGVCLQPWSCWCFAPSVRALKWVVEVVGCTSASLAHLSCTSCMCLDSFLLRVLLRNKFGLSDSVACSSSSFGVHCCSMVDGGCIGGRANKHVSGILGGISASSSSCDSVVLVRDVEGGSSLSADRILIVSVVVLSSGVTM